MRKNLWIQKALSVICVITLLFSAASLPSMFALASSEPTVTVSDTSGKQGDVVTVNVSISNNPGVYSFVVSLSYDATKLKLTGVTNGSVLTGPQHNTGPTGLALNPYRLTFCDALAMSDNTNNGVIATLTFEVLSDATDGDATITAAIDQDNTFNMAFDPCDFVTENGKVTVYHDHIAGDWEITTEAGCLTTGERVKKCTVCNHVMDTDTIAALNHNWGAWVIDTEADCTNSGSRHRVCLRCSTREDDTINAHGHTPGAWNATKEASCTELGSKEQRCTVCNTVVDTQDIAMVEHILGDWEVTKAATCTESGTREKKCTICNSTRQSEEIPATGHSYGEWGVVTPATFDTDGQQKRTCTNCPHFETQRIPKLSESHTHSYTGIESITKAATCLEDGSKKVYCSETACGEYITVDIPATGHTHGAWETTKAATCTEDGQQIKKCTVCGTTVETQALTNLGHSFGEWKVRTASTCTAEGVEYRECSRCPHEETRAIPAKGHTHGNWEVTKAATCTEDGQQIKKCTDCGTTVDTQVITMLGHGFGEWKVRTAATCTTAGLEYRECSRCPHEETRAIDAKGHTPGAWEITKAATCTEDGQQIKKCTVCGTTVDTQVLAQLGHAYGAWQERTAPTETTDGLDFRTCANCDDEQTRAVTLTGITLNTSEAKKTYFEGADLSLDSVTVVATYSTGKIMNIPAETHMISGYDKDTVGEQTITVSYGSFSKTYTVTVLSKKAVNDIIAEIDEIDIDELSVDDEDDIILLKDAYDALTENEKAEIPADEKAKLDEAVDTINALVRPALDEWDETDTVNVQADSGVVRYDTTLKIVPVESNADTLAAIRAKYGAESVFACYYDIYLLDTNDERIQPNGMLKITMKLPTEYTDGKDLVLLCIGEDGSVTEITSASIANGEVVFETELLGQYAVAKAIAASDDNTGGDKDKDDDKNTDNGTDITSPPTGDNSNIALMFILMLCSLAGLISLTVVNRKGRRTA